MSTQPSDQRDQERSLLLATFTGRRVAVALAFGALAALGLSPVFRTSLPELLGRTLFVAVALLFVYGLAGRWPQRWLPGWMPRGLVQWLAVALTAPVVTFAIYLLTVGGDVARFFGEPSRVMGFVLIAGLALFLGVLIATAALLGERDAQVRTQALQFELQRSQLEKQAVDARLSLLQAQIEPHFLFNTLANVQALVESGSPRAPAVLSALIAYLRAAMPRLHDEQPTLGNELALVGAYLELMQMRMPDRLQVTIDADPALGDRRFPAMALLTLVENAVHHGIDPSEEGGHIEVGARAADQGGMTLWVRDTGVGMAPQATPGTGLDNLRARLEAFFGRKARLHWSPVEPHGLRAEIQVPEESTA